MRSPKTGHYDPGFVSAVETALAELTQLPPGWDGYGAPAIEPAVIAAARRFVRSLPENLAYRPQVVPMSPGNLQLEWHHGPKTLELEFEDAHTIHYLQWHPETGMQEEGTIRAAEVDRAVEFIQWFMTGTGL